VHYPPIDLSVSLPCVMGIVNVTPDSFSDGGLHADTDSAVAHGLLLAAEGAAILDVGGESTRPGSDPVAPDDELARVVPVIERLAAGSHALISIDTTKAVVARAALDAGAVLVNDVTALRGDIAMAALVAESGCALCLMHMLGEPRTMQDDPRYDDVVGEVAAFLEERMAFAVAAGVREEQLLLDPGIGFGKTLQHNLLLLAHLDRFAALGRPLVLGASRKRFIGALLGAEPRERTYGTVATTVLGLARGAAIVRVHDVRPNVEALRVAQAILDADAPAADPAAAGVAPAADGSLAGLAPTADTPSAGRRRSPS
jgi:dihydropteroate synthase